MLSIGQKKIYCRTFWLQVDRIRNIIINLTPKGKILSSFGHNMFESKIIYMIMKLTYTCNTAFLSDYRSIPTLINLLTVCFNTNTGKTMFDITTRFIVWIIFKCQFEKKKKTYTYSMTFWSFYFVIFGAIKFSLYL